MTEKVLSQNEITNKQEAIDNVKETSKREQEILKEQILQEQLRKEQKEAIGAFAAYYEEYLCDWEKAEILSDFGSIEEFLLYGTGMKKLEMQDDKNRVETTVGSPTDGLSAFAETIARGIRLFQEARIASKTSQAQAKVEQLQQQDTPNAQADVQQHPLVLFKNEFSKGLVEVKTQEEFIKAKEIYDRIEQYRKEKLQTEKQKMQQEKEAKDLAYYKNRCQALIDAINAHQAKHTLTDEEKKLFTQQNGVFVLDMTNKTKDELVSLYDQLYAIKQRLDNEASIMQAKNSSNSSKNTINQQGDVLKVYSEMKARSDKILFSSITTGKNASYCRAIIQKNSEGKSVTYCSRTAHLVAKHIFGLNLVRGDAYDVMVMKPEAFGGDGRFKGSVVDSALQREYKKQYEMRSKRKVGSGKNSLEVTSEIRQITEQNKNENLDANPQPIPGKSILQDLTNENFINQLNLDINVADIYVSSKSVHGHRAIMFRAITPAGPKWYVIDPYRTGDTTGKPVPYEQYVAKPENHIIKANFYATGKPIVA